MSVCRVIGLWFRRTWLSASNAHAYRLYIVNERSLPFSGFDKPAVISEALNYDTTYFAFCAFEKKFQLFFNTRASFVLRRTPVLSGPLHEQNPKLLHTFNSLGRSQLAKN